MWANVGERFMDLLKSIDWKFVLGDIVMPFFIFFLGVLVGQGIEKRKAKSKIKGNNNVVLQNVDITGGDKR